MSRIFTLFAAEGAWVTLNFVLLRATAIVRGERGAREWRSFGGYWFDKYHGVETSVEVDRFELDVPDESRSTARSFVGTPPHVFHAVMRRLPIDAREFSFIDFGSGKGRVLMMAAELPFRRVLGIEISPTLDEICRKNIRQAQHFSGDLARVETVCADAMRYQFPPGNLVLFFYNPFDEQVLAAVLRNLEQALQNEPRKIHILYWHPYFVEALDREDFLAKVHENAIYPQYVIYTNDKAVYCNQANSRDIPHAGAAASNPR